jgi:hypothetical protein
MKMIFAQTVASTSHCVSLVLPAYPLIYLVNLFNFLIYEYLLKDLLTVTSNITFRTNAFIVYVCSMDYIRRKKSDTGAVERMFASQTKNNYHSTQAPSISQLFNELLYQWRTRSVSKQYWLPLAHWYLPRNNTSILCRVCQALCGTLCLASVVVSSLALPLDVRWGKFAIARFDVWVWNEDRTTLLCPSP